MTETEKLIDYIQVESRILRKLDPRTKGVRSADWDGYNEEMDKLLIIAKPIHVGDIKKLCDEFNVPFFEDQVVSVVTQWNERYDM